MAYDEKTGRITTNGDKQAFEKDMFAHFSNIDAKVTQELARKANQKEKKTLKQRIQSLGRSTKLSLVLFIAWTVIVIYRTSGYQELLGFSLQPWDTDYVIMNWLVVPAALYIIFRSIKWSLR
jgi:hypothetical protein